MFYSSESDFKINFNKEINKILFYDLYNSLSNTDFERRFFKFQIDIMKEMNQEMEKYLLMKECFNFSGVSQTTIAQILECLFPQMGEVLKTVPIRLFHDKESKNHFDFKDYEIMIAEFSNLGGKVEVIEKYSTPFIIQGLKKLRNSLYYDMLFQNGKSGMTSLSREVINKQIDVFIERVSEILSCQSEVLRVVSNVETRENIINAMSFKKLLIEISILYNSDKEYFPKYDSVYMNEERIIVAYYLTFVQNFETNISNDLTKYFSTNSHQTQIEEFFNYLNVSSLTYEWYVPCELADIKNKTIFYSSAAVELGLFKNSDLIEQIDRLPPNIKILSEVDKSHEFYFWGKLSEQSEDVSKSLGIFKEYCSEILDGMYFLEDMPFPHELLWQKAFCLISEGGEYRKITSDGWNRRYLNQLDNEEFKNVLYKYTKITELRYKNPENDLSSRFLCSLKLYKDFLHIENLEDRLLKLWNILEVLTAQDKVDKLAAMVAYFPILFPSEIVDMNFTSLQECEKSEYYRVKYNQYVEIISDLGSLRNNYVAHKNRGVLVPENRFEKNLKVLQKIVLQTQRVIFDCLINSEKTEYSKVRHIIKDVRKHLGLLD